MAMKTLAREIAGQMKVLGTPRAFGVPGGGSSLQLIEAFEDAGIPFVLTATESAAAIMAAVTGELTGAPGVALAGVGPGAASAVNGVAYSHLERAPMAMFTDGPASSLHQAFDQNGLYAPITRARGRLTPETGAAVLAEGLARALTVPPGPVQFDLTAGDAKAHARAAPLLAPADPAPQSEGDIAALIAASRRPAFIVGLEARSDTVSAAVVRLLDNVTAPVFTSYRAKGVVPCAHPRMIGHFTGASLEAACLGRADLLVFLGFDPVEMIPAPWRYQAPVIELRAADGAGLPVPPAARATGDLESLIEDLASLQWQSEWTADTLSDFKNKQAAALRVSGSGNTVDTIMDAVNEHAPDNAVLTVDAGAHMISAMARWRAGAPNSVFKSNGLSTMGYALPAAIAASLNDPARKVIALTGDGGMLMCLSELTTAAGLGCNLTVIVLNDGALSLIDIKQQAQQMKRRGVAGHAVDFAQAARGFGVAAECVGIDQDPGTAIRRAFSGSGPALLDIRTDPSGFARQLEVLRG
ncbi:MAG: thiamine pyrophosphate-binding protein [Pseudomonadota bacterium]